MTQFHPSLRGPCRRAPKISLEALEAPPLPASSLLLPVQEAQQSPDQSTTPCHRIPMGKALPLPPPHMSEGWPPWALHPCYLRGGGRWLAFQMCLANRTRKDSGRGGDRRKHGNITLKTVPAHPDQHWDQAVPRCSGWGSWKHYLASFPPLHKSLPPRERHPPPTPHPTS